MSESEHPSTEEIAERLLDAQVRFLAASLGPAGFSAILETEVDSVLAAFAQLTLGAVVTREQIKAVAIKYAVAMRIPGSIPEIASEIADRIYNHPAQETNRFDEVVPARHVEELVGKVLELPLVRERLLTSPVLLELAAEWVYRVAVEAAGDVGGVAARIPGLSALLGVGGKVVEQLRPDAALELETHARAAAERATQVLLRRAQGAAVKPEEPWMHEAIIEVWREQSDRPMASLRELFSQEDLEEILVLLYDLWLSLRETPYLHAMIDEGVDFIFDTYAETTLLGLLAEFGITRADLVEEAQRFAPPVLALLSENGMLEAFLRRRLEPFYRTPEALALLSRD